MDDSLIDKVFGNSLIWEELGNYLSFGEFANLRLVSRIMKNRVDDSENFRGKCWKHVFMRAFFPQQVIPQDDCTLTCRNIKIVFVSNIPGDRDGKSRHPEPTSDVLSPMKGLKISQFLQSPRISHGRVEITTAESLQSAMELIIQKMVGLETFLSNILLISKIDMCRFDVTKIKNLVIFRPGTTSASLSSTEIDRLTSNMEHFSRNIKKLQSFGFIENSKAMAAPSSIFSAISTTLGNNTEKLQRLEIVQPEFWKAFPEMANIVFSSLRTLKIETLYDSRDTIEGFLEKQPLLEHLKLVWKDYFPTSVYNVVSRKSANCRVLHVKGMSFGPSENSGNWDFLSGLEFLDDFEIKCQQKNQSKPRYGTLATYKDILEVLPKTVRKLHIRGLPSPSNGTKVGKQLLTFPNLQEVRLLRCPGILGDDCVLSLFSNQEFCKRVYTFEISHCDDITNSGLHGKHTSINNMQELRRLTVKRCPNISDAFLDKLSLPNLNFLDVSSNRKLQANAVAQTVVRCRKLQMLRSSWKLAKQMRSLGVFVRLLHVEDAYGAYDVDSGSD